MEDYFDPYNPTDKIAKIQIDRSFVKIQNVFININELELIERYLIQDFQITDYLVIEIAYENDLKNLYLNNILDRLKSIDEFNIYIIPY